MGNVSLQKTKYIWMDGKFVSWDKANVHILTHSLHYGGAVFEGIRCYETKKGTAVFRLREHIDRLYKSADVFEMKIPFSREEMVKAALETVRKNKLKSGYIRPICFFGYGMMGLNPSKCAVNCAIAVWPWGKYLAESVRAKISKYIRIHPRSTKADAKITGHYVNSILASIEAKNAGYDEAVLLDYKNNIAEGPGENIFFTKGNVLITPKFGNILPGITRDSIIILAKDLGYKIVEKDIAVDELPDFDEAFYTGTAAEVTPIKSINSINYKIGPVGLRLKNEFYRIVSGENKKYEKWMSFV